VELLIDGIPTASSSAWWHHQTDPFPGGHRYWMRASTRGDHPKRMGIAPGRNLGKSSANSLFNALHQAGALWPQPGAEPAWVLNTIEVVAVQGDVITLEGVCSQLVRQPRGGLDDLDSHKTTIAEHDP
jgi:hypothetical protein